MSEFQQDTRRTDSTRDLEFDAVVVGAGFAGIAMLHRLRQLGISVRVYEAGADVGGTWYWNRYPGARCDSESVYYMFSDHISAGILQEWSWSERYAAQPEILRYLRFVAEKLDVRRDIQFNTRIVEATYDEARNRWQITTADGACVLATYLITAVGCLSVTNLPTFNGLETFQGSWYHTGHWPHEPVDFSGQRVAVIGTGATGVQLVPEVAKQAAHLYVFQRTANYDIPGRNHLLDQGYAQQIKLAYPELWQRMRASSGGFPHVPMAQSALAATPAERERIYQAAWDAGGFQMFMSTFNDLSTSQEANETLAAFIRAKIREIVHDPAVAELLVPHDHPFGAKRPPLEHGYYAAFNRDNVTLVDVRSAPIETITPAGIRTEAGEYAVDSIIFATGFDAVTGPLFSLNIHGRGGLSLREAWADGPRTYLGLTANRFPNIFMITGPQSPSVFTNMPVAIEQHVEWIGACIQHVHGQHAYIEAQRASEDAWVAHATALAEEGQLLDTASWWVGANIPGKPRVVYAYTGGLNAYRERCDAVAAQGYVGFEIRQVLIESNDAR